MNPPTVFRCDGDARMGAGHVARCLNIARAFRLAGHTVLFVGVYDGIAGLLVAAAGFPTAGPAEGPCGVPASAAGAIVDSYEIADRELSTLASQMPVAAICDGDAAPEVTAAISYRLDADDLHVPPGTTGILGPDYAPINPELARARHPRGFSRALVTMGASPAGERAAVSALHALLALEDIEVFVAGTIDLPSALARDGRLSAGVEHGLRQRVGWSDVAVSSAGTTAYDLACAGVPTVLRAIAANQRPYARAFEAAEVALVAEDDSDGGMAEAVGRLADAGVRGQLARRGPALFDGYGAFRARDAIVDSFAGRPPRPPLRYRPATRADRASLLRWRNDPASRAASHDTEPISEATHEQWLATRLDRPDGPLLIVESGGEPVGSVRFDRDGPTARIAISIDPHHRGAGVGKRVIRETCEFLFAAEPGIDRVTAEVRRANVASRRAFVPAGFSLEREDDAWLLLGLVRAARPVAAAD